MIKFQKKILKSGLRVITAPMANTEAATFLVLVGVGSRYEDKKINGISHFLEHLFFKGTKSRPKPGQISHDLDKIGASHNAFTGKEYMGFWVKSASKDFDTGLDIVSDMLFEPLFKKEEIEKERGVIIQEINMYEDLPQKKVWEILENTMYGDQPIGWDILGSKETVSNISREDIVKYRKENYLSKNMLVVAAGDIEQENIFKKIEKNFSKIKPGRNKPYKKARVFQKEPRVKLVKKDSDQTHLAIGIEAFDMFDDRRYALNVLAVILGGNTSSRLWMEIREKLGLAYTVFSQSDLGMDCGYLGIGAGIPHEKLGLVSKKIVEAFKIFKNKNVSEKELKDAKSYIRGQTALGLETSDEIANFCANQELFYGKILQPEEFLEKIEKVSRNDLLKVAKEIFIFSRINMAVIGAEKDIKGKEVFLKNLFSSI